MDGIYMIITLSIVPLFPLRLAKLMQENPNYAKSKEGKKRLQRVWRWYRFIAPGTILGCMAWFPKWMNEILYFTSTFGAFSILATYLLTNGAQCEQFFKKVAVKLKKITVKEEEQ